MEKPVIAWWSAGLTSAVACKMTLSKYDNVRIVYIETGSAHEDNARFIADCEKWYGQKIELIRTDKYEDVSDVILTERYVNGPGGARCTTELKKEVRLKFERENEYFAQVHGFEFVKSQINRAVRFIDKYAYSNPQFPLIEKRINKNECAGIIINAGIELPEMYKLGYSNNNCIGCVKGGKGYWNKIRVDFPEVFAQRSYEERQIGHSCIKGVFLDELKPNEGRMSKEIMPECGAFCQSEFADIYDERTERIIQGDLFIDQLYAA